jgi:hypothetical protein
LEVCGQRAQLDPQPWGRYGVSKAGSEEEEEAERQNRKEQKRKGKIRHSKLVRRRRQAENASQTDRVGTVRPLLGKKAV